MTGKIEVSHEANTALTWAFGAYADKDPGIPWEIARASEADGDEPLSREDVDRLAQMLIQGAITEGLGGRICLGWCTIQREGRLGLGVMVLKRPEA